MFMQSAHLFGVTASRPCALPRSTDLRRLLLGRECLVETISLLFLLEHGEVGWQLLAAVLVEAGPSY